MTGQEARDERPLTPCGNIACTGCRVCGCPALGIAPQEARDEGQIYVRRGGVYLLDEHAGVMIDSAGNFVAKTRGEPRAMAAMLRLIAADIEEGAPRLAREWKSEWPDHDAAAATAAMQARAKEAQG